MGCPLGSRRLPPAHHHQLPTLTNAHSAAPAALGCAGEAVAVCPETSMAFWFQFIFTYSSSSKAFANLSYSIFFFGFGCAGAFSSFVGLGVVCFLLYVIFSVTFRWTLRLGRLWFVLFMNDDDDGDISSCRIGDGLIFTKIVNDKCRLCYTCVTQR